MRWLKPRKDPLAAKSKALDKRLAMVRSEIRQLKLSLGNESQGKDLPAEERRPVRSAAGSNGGHPFDPPSGSVHHAPFRKNGNAKPQNGAENNGGLDWKAWLRKVRRGFSDLDPEEARFVNYLAAGSFEGMRPLRYERRVARNRIIFLSLCFLLFLFTVITLLWPS